MWYKTRKNLRFKEDRSSMKTNLLSQPQETSDRLAKLGLDALVFIQAIQRSQVVADGYTQNHPPISRGIGQWSEVVAALRDQLIPRGWTRDDRENRALTVNPTKTIAISAATGDENTGIADLTPCTSSSKGPKTQDAVIINALQLELFGNVPLTPQELKKSPGVMTFMLLFHRDLKAKETRVELSRPVVMDSDGNVIVWAERIVLPPVPFGIEGAKISEDAPQQQEIIPEVKRKRA
jgi:hypothetical protein